MTDNEIIKALECCQHKTYSHCKECVFVGSPSCTSHLAKNTLDLLNRKQEDIEWAEDRILTIIELKAEIERLERSAKQWEDTARNLFISKENIKAETKAETVYKYMKILEAKLAQNNDISGFAYQSVIWDMSQSYSEMTKEI